MISLKEIDRSLTIQDVSGCLCSEIELDASTKIVYVGLCKDKDGNPNGVLAGTHNNRMFDVLYWDPTGDPCTLKTILNDKWGITRMHMIAIDMHSPSLYRDIGKNQSTFHSKERIGIMLTNALILQNSLRIDDHHPNPDTSLSFVVLYLPLLFTNPL